MKRFLFSIALLCAVIATAYSQSIPFPGPGAAVQSTSVVVTFASSNEDNAGATSTTYTAQAIGTAAANRQVVVCFWGPRVGGTGGTQTSVTIGGVSATNISGANVNNTSDGNTSRMQMWMASVPTGTTANIVTVVNSGGAQSIGVWALYGASTTPPSGAATSTSTASPAAMTLSFAANGAGISCAGDINAGGFTSMTWTGLTEDYDVRASNSRSGASLAFTPAQVLLAVTGTYTGAARPAAVAAGFAP